MVELRSYRPWAGGDAKRRDRQRERVMAYWTPERREEARMKAKAAYYQWTAEEQAKQFVAEREAMDQRGRAMIAEARGYQHATTQPQEERPMTAVPGLPAIEWQWGRIAIHEGQLMTQADVEEAVAVLEFMASKLPPGIKAALDKAEKKRARQADEEVAA